jgi:DNA-binding IclR family transcriptional regulator
VSEISANARKLLNVFVRFKAKRLPFQSLTGSYGVAPEAFESVMAELIASGLVEHDEGTIHYRLTFDGWSHLGSPAVIAFPEFP